MQWIKGIEKKAYGRDTINASEEEVTVFDLPIGQDGTGVLITYLEKYCKDRVGKEAVKEALEDFVNDVEQYAMPEVERLKGLLDNSASFSGEQEEVVEEAPAEETPVEGTPPIEGTPLQ
jgi:hypothetical protein